MKLKIEFDTCDENHNQSEMEAVLKAQDMALALYDIDMKIRNWVKYDNRNEIPVDEIREEFNEILEQYNLALDKLTE